MKNNIGNKLLNIFTRKRNVIIFFLASVLFLISTLIFTNFAMIASRVNTVIHDIKMSLVDVDGFEISQVLIDQDGNEYDSFYEWNATDYNDKRTLTLQINYKKTNDKTYEPGELVIIVPNLFTKQSYVNSIVSSDPCRLQEKTSTWNFSTDSTKCSNSYVEISSNNYDNIYFYNTERIDANTNFEGTIRIMYNTINPVNLLYNLDTTSTTSLNNKIFTNSIRFKFTSNKRGFKLTANNEKIQGYDGLPSNADQYIWVHVGLAYSPSNTGVRRFTYYSNYPSDTKPSNTGLSYQSYKYRSRYRISLPSNAIVYYNYDAFTYEVENGVGYYRYNNNEYYYNGKNIGYGDDYYNYNGCRFYIGFPKSQYSNTTVSYSVDMYGIYADYSERIDESKTHNYEYIASVNQTINTANYIYSTQPSRQSYYVTYPGQNNNLDVDNLKTGIDFDYSFKAFYTGTKMNVKIGNDFVYKKSTSGSISKLSDGSYYYHRISFYTELKDINNNTIFPGRYNIDLFVRHRYSNSYVKYGDTFINTNETKDFIFSENDIVDYYFMIYDVETSLIGVNPIRCNIVFENNSIYQGDELYISNFIATYRPGYSYPIYSPSDSDYGYNMSSEQKETLMPILKSYDNSKYGYYMVRSVSKAKAVNTYKYLYGFNNSWGPPNIHRKSIYKAGLPFHLINESYSYNDNEGFIKRNYGYEIYILLPEGWFADTQNEYSIFNHYYQTEMYKSGFVRKNDGSLFNDSRDYINYVKDHLTINVYNNWKNSRRQMMKVTVDFRDAPLDFTDFHYFNSSLSSSYYIPEHYEFNIYFDKDNIIEYNRTEYEVEMYTKTFNASSPVLPPDSQSKYIKDTQDINNDGNTSEYLSQAKWTYTVNLTEESNQDLMSFVRSEKDDYNSQYTAITANDNYSYKLRVRTATNKITNLVIYDNLENNIKENGQYIKAAGDVENTFRGTFQGVDTSYAQSQGYYVKVYYSESETPGALGSDSTWKTYSASSTDKSKVKSLAFEYYNSSRSSKAVIPKDNLTYVIVNMKAPSNIDGNKVVTYNGSWSEWNALDASNNVIPNVVGISSNKVSAAIKSTLTVKHYLKGTTTELAPEVTTETFGGNEYTTRTASVPSGYTFDSTVGDPTSGTISKTYTEVIYYYRKITPTVSSLLTKQGTDSLAKRNEQINYQISYTASVQDYIGDSSITIVDTLPYEIDTDKEYDLDGGTYDATNKTITWNKTLTTSSLDGVNQVYVFNIKLSYKNIPVTVRSITNKVNSTITMDTKTDNKETTKSTNITEQFKLTVHHYYKDTTDSISPDVITYHDGGSNYQTNPANVSPNYEITTPANANGVINSEETVVTYYYQKRTAELTTTLDKTGTDTLSKRNDQVSYQITYNAKIKKYIGDSNVVIVDTLPYEIDTAKEYNLDGGVYNAGDKTITWNKTITTTTIDEKSETITLNVSFSYKNIPITTKSITNKVKSTITFDDVSDTKEKEKVTNITEKYKLTVHHYYYGTTDSISPDVITYHDGGSEYTTSAANVSPNYEITTPANANGTILSEETTVTYYYNKRNSSITTTLDKTGTDVLTSRKGQVSYQISYTAKIKDYAGNSSLTIVDTLPYEIDTSKTYNLDGGVYNA